MVDLQSFKPSTMFTSDHSQRLAVNESYRNSTSFCLPERLRITEILHSAINEALLIYRDRLSQLNTIFDRYPVPGGWKVRCHREAIQLIRYLPGQKYDFHHDASDEFVRKEYRRTISVIVYLTDEFSGGATEFTHRSFRPAKGEALIFPSCWTHPHCAQPVTSGEKIVAVTWYYSDLQR